MTQYGSANSLDARRRPVWAGRFSAIATDTLFALRPAEARWELGDFQNPAAWNPLSLDGSGNAWDGRVFFRGDFDGDGLDELIVYVPAAGGWLLAMRAGADFSWEAVGAGAGMPVAAPTSSSPKFTADFDGDGKAEILLHDPLTGNWGVGDLEAGGLTWTAAGNTLGAGGGPNLGMLVDRPAWVGDFDGSGKAQLLLFGAAGFSRGEWDGNVLSWSGLGMAPDGLGALMRGGPAWVGRYTQTGQDELLALSADRSQLWNGLLGGGGFTWTQISDGAATPDLTGSAKDGMVWSGDFTGAGRDQLLVYFPAENLLRTGIYDGALLQWSDVGAAPYAKTLDGGVFFCGDFQGSGRPGLLMFDFGSKSWMYGLSDGATLQWQPLGAATRLPSLIDLKQTQVNNIQALLGDPTGDDELAADLRGYRRAYQGGAIFWSIGSAAFETNGMIHAKYMALGGEGGLLGYPTSDETATADGAGRFNHFVNGSIFWHPSTGAFEVHGAIRACWFSLGAERGFLGYPVTDESDTGTRTGRYNHFQGGTVLWSAASGAHEVHGLIREKYAALGWEAGVMGYPTSNEEGHGNGGRINRFEGGVITWSPQTGAHEIHGEICVRYLYLAAQNRWTGFATSDEMDAPGGRKSEFQFATIYWSGASGAREVHGAIRDRYLSLGGPGGFLGYPLTDEEKVLNGSGAEIGRVNRFQGATVYWSAGTGAFEVHGAIREYYERTLGGPAGSLGFPLSNENGVGGSDVRYNDFQTGVIHWTPGTGARAVQNLDLYIGWVRSGSIDDGITWTGSDHSAELITYTTVEVNGAALESNQRRPDGHSGDSYNIDKHYAIGPVRGNTTIHLKIRVDDWDMISSNDFLGELDMTFGAIGFWGMDHDNGLFLGTPSTSKGGDAPSLNTIKYDFSISPPSTLDPSLPFRQQAWWKFDNFKTPVLSREDYANVFSDVEVTDNAWEEFVHPFDSLYYAIAFKGVAASGNCFGMSLESLYALNGHSVFHEPIIRFDKNNSVSNAINRRHGYQLGAESIRWTIGKLLSTQAISPITVFNNIRFHIDRGTPVLLSMFSLDKGSGHTVLAIAYDTQPDGKRRIYVADPNVPWAEAMTPLPSYAEIATDNTFQFISNGRVSYKSDKIVGGLLPGTFMFETPFHVVSSQPATPFWEILAGLMLMLGGVILLAGDAETTELRGDGANYYVKPGDNTVFNLDPSRFQMLMEVSGRLQGHAQINEAQILQVAEQVHPQVLQAIQNLRIQRGGGFDALAGGIQAEILHAAGGQPAHNLHEELAPHIGEGLQNIIGAAAGAGQNPPPVETSMTLAQLRDRIGIDLVSHLFDKRSIKPGAIPGFARIPVLSLVGSPFMNLSAFDRLDLPHLVEWLRTPELGELYAQAGRLPNRLEFRLRGTGSDRYNFGMRAGKHSFVLDSPAIARGLDDVLAEGARFGNPVFSFDTDQPARTAQVKYAVAVDDLGRSVRAFQADLGMAREQTARLVVEEGGQNFTLQSAGPQAPANIQVAMMDNGVVRSGTLRLDADLTGSAIRIRPADVVSPLGDQVIERLDGLNGGVIERFTRPMQP